MLNKTELWERSLKQIKGYLTSSLSTVDKRLTSLSGDDALLWTSLQQTLKTALDQFDPFPQPSGRSEITTEIQRILSDTLGDVNLVLTYLNLFGFSEDPTLKKLIAEKNILINGTQKANILSGIKETLLQHSSPLHSPIVQNFKAIAAEQAVLLETEKNNIATSEATHNMLGDNNAIKTSQAQAQIQANTTISIFINPGWIDELPTAEDLTNHFATLPQPKPDVPKFLVPQKIKDYLYTLTDAVGSSLFRGETKYTRDTLAKLRGLKNILTTDQTSQKTASSLPHKFLQPFFALMIKDKGLQDFVQRNDDEVLLDYTTDLSKVSNDPFYTLSTNQPDAILEASRTIDKASKLLPNTHPNFNNIQQIATQLELAAAAADFNQPFLSWADFLRVFNKQYMGDSSADENAPERGPVSKAFHAFIIDVLNKFPLSQAEKSTLPSLTESNFSMFLSVVSPAILPSLLSSDTPYILAKIREKFGIPIRPPSPTPSLSGALEARLGQFAQDTPEAVEAALRTTNAVRGEGQTVSFLLSNAFVDKDKNTTFPEKITLAVCNKLWDLILTPDPDDPVPAVVKESVNYIISEILTNPFARHDEEIAHINRVFGIYARDLNAVTSHHDLIFASLKTAAQTQGLSTDEQALINLFITQAQTVLKDAAKNDRNNIETLTAFNELLTMLQLELNNGATHLQGGAFETLVKNLITQKNAHLDSLPLPTPNSDAQIQYINKSFIAPTDKTLWGDETQQGEINTQLGDSYELAESYLKQQNDLEIIPPHINVFITGMVDISPAITRILSDHILSATFKNYFQSLIDEINTTWKNVNPPQKVIELKDVLTKLVSQERAAGTRPLPFDITKQIYESISIKNQNTALKDAASRHDDSKYSDAAMLHAANGPQFGASDITSNSNRHNLVFTTNNRPFVDSVYTAAASPNLIQTAARVTAIGALRGIAIALTKKSDPKELQSDIENLLTLIPTLHDIAASDLQNPLDSQIANNIIQFFKGYPENLNTLYEQAIQNITSINAINDVISAILYALPADDAAAKITAAITQYQNLFAQVALDALEAPNAEALLEQLADFTQNFKKLQEILMRAGHEALFPKKMLPVLESEGWSPYHIEPLLTTSEAFIAFHDGLLKHYIKRLIEHAKNAVNVASQPNATQNAQSSAYKAITDALTMCDLYLYYAETLAVPDDIIAVYQQGHMALTKLQAQTAGYFSSTISRATLEQTSLNQNKIFSTSIKAENAEGGAELIGVLHRDTRANNTAVNGYLYQGKRYIWRDDNTGQTQQYYEALAENQNIPLEASQKYYQNLPLPGFFMAQGSIAIKGVEGTILETNHTANLYSDQSGTHLQGTVYGIALQDITVGKIITLPMLMRANYTFKNGEFELDVDGIQTNSRIAKYLCFGHNGNIPGDQILLLATIEADVDHNIELPAENQDTFDAVKNRATTRGQMLQRSDTKSLTIDTVGLVKKLLGIADPALPAKPLSLKSAILAFIDKPYNTPEQWDLLNGALEFLSTSKDDKQAKADFLNLVTATLLLNAYSEPAERVLLKGLIDSFVAQYEIATQIEGRDKTITELTVEAIQALGTKDFQKSPISAQLKKLLRQLVAVETPHPQGAAVPVKLPIADEVKTFIAANPAVTKLSQAQEATPAAVAEATQKTKTLEEAQLDAQITHKTEIFLQNYANEPIFSQALIYALAKSYEIENLQNKNFKGITREVVEKSLTVSPRQGMVESPIRTLFKKIIAVNTRLPDVESQTAAIDTYGVHKLMLDNLALIQSSQQIMTPGEKTLIQAFATKTQHLFNQPVALATYNELLTALKLECSNTSSPGFTNLVDALVEHKNKHIKELAAAQARVTPLEQTLAAFTSAFNNSALGRTGTGSTQDAICNDFNNTYIISQVYSDWRDDNKNIPYHLSVFSTPDDNQVLDEVIKNTYYLSSAVLAHLKSLRQEINAKWNNEVPEKLQLLAGNLNTILNAPASYEKSTQPLPFDLARTLYVSIATKTQDTALLNAASQHNNLTLTDAAILNTTPFLTNDKNEEFNVGTARKFLDNIVLEARRAEIKNTSQNLDRVIEINEQLNTLKNTVARQDAKYFPDILKTMSILVQSARPDESWYPNIITDIVTFLKNLPVSQSARFDHLYAIAKEDDALFPNDLMMVEVLAALRADNTEQKIKDAIAACQKSFNQTIAKYLSEPNNDGATLIPYTNAFTRLQSVLQAAGYKHLFPGNLLVLEATARNLKPQLQKLDEADNLSIKTYFNEDSVKIIAELLTLDLPEGQNTLAQLMLAAEQRLFEFTPFQEELYNSIETLLRAPTADNMQQHVATLNELSSRDDAAVKKISISRFAEINADAAENVSQEYEARSIITSALKDHAQTVTTHKETLNASEVAASSARLERITTTGKLKFGDAPLGYFASKAWNAITALPGKVVDAITTGWNSIKSAISSFINPSAPKAAAPIEKPKNPLLQQARSPDTDYDIESTHIRRKEYDKEKNAALNIAGQPDVTAAELTHALTRLDKVLAKFKQLETDLNTIKTRLAPDSSNAQNVTQDITEVRANYQALEKQVFDFEKKAYRFGQNTVMNDIRLLSKEDPLKQARILASGNTLHTTLSQQIPNALTSQDVVRVTQILEFLDTTAKIIERSHTTKPNDDLNTLAKAIRSTIAEGKVKLAAPLAVTPAPIAPAVKGAPLTASAAAVKTNLGPSPTPQQFTDPEPLKHNILFIHGLINDGDTNWDDQRYKKYQPVRNGFEQILMNRATVSGKELLTLGNNLIRQFAHFSDQFKQAMPNANQTTMQTMDQAVDDKAISAMRPVMSEVLELSQLYFDSAALIVEKRYQLDPSNTDLALLATALRIDHQYAKELHGRSGVSPATQQAHELARECVALLTRLGDKPTKDSLTKEMTALNTIATHLFSINTNQSQIFIQQIQKKYAELGVQLQALATPPSPTLTVAPTLRGADSPTSVGDDADSDAESEKSDKSKESDKSKASESSATSASAADLADTTKKAKEKEAAKNTTMVNKVNFDWHKKTFSPIAEAAAAAAKLKNKI